MPLQETSGTASYDAFGGGVAAVPNYIEDVFSTYLYTGNDSARTINNGIDLAGKGGLVWIKIRGSAGNHILTDTARGVRSYLRSNTTDAQVTPSATFGVTSFESNGFGLDQSIGSLLTNTTGQNYASWTFRKQPKFFDVVTYTGDSTNNRQISHSLGATPGCIIIKIINGNNSWIVWHNSLPTQAGELNATGSFLSAYYTNLLNGAPTSTTFTVSHNGFNTTNETGYTYVAYLFAHNAGGFGLTGTDNVISCGSWNTGAGGGASVTLGYEPQWVLIKSASGTGGWYTFDNMRGWVLGGASAGLRPDTSAAEFNFGNSSLPTNPTATGFTITDGLLPANETWIYIAIRRGPMKTPTSGTSVYNAVTVTGNSTANRAITGFGFPLDLLLSAGRTGTYLDKAWNSRLTDAYYVRSTTTAAEDIQYGALADLPFAYMDGYQTGTNGGVQFYWNNSGDTYVQYGMRRAPGFFDEVCYTGTGVATSQTHNLGVVPELIIVKGRSAAFGWATYSATLGIGYYLTVNNTAAAAADPSNVLWNNVPPTSTTFRVGTNPTVNGSGSTYVAYLFASCPGVSKVGSYTGNGSTQTINCGFTGGARFVLIKRTDSAGDWYVYDTARGMTTLTDPYLLLNSTAAESATLGSVTSVTGGFALNASILAAINTNAASYIFLAIA